MKIDYEVFIFDSVDSVDLREKTKPLFHELKRVANLFFFMIKVFLGYHHILLV